MFAHVQVGAQPAASAPHNIVEAHQAAAPLVTQAQAEVQLLSEARDDGLDLTMSPVDEAQDLPAGVREPLPEAKKPRCGDPQASAECAQ